MKRTIFALTCLIISITATSWLVVAKRVRQSQLPPGAFLVSVKACEAETGILVPFTVSTESEGKNVSIEDVAIKYFTSRSLCQWIDWTTRVIRVESKGYEPRLYAVSGNQKVNAILYSVEEEERHNSDWDSLGTLNWHRKDPETEQ